MAGGAAVFGDPGAMGRIEGREFWVGSHRYLEERGQEEPTVHELIERLSFDGSSVVVAVVFAESDDEMPAEEVEALNAASRDLATALQGTRAAT